MGEEGGGCGKFTRSVKKLVRYGGCRGGGTGGLAHLGRFVVESPRLHGEMRHRVMVVGDAGGIDRLHVVIVDERLVARPRLAEVVSE